MPKPGLSQRGLLKSLMTRAFPAPSAVFVSFCICPSLSPLFGRWPRNALAVFENELVANKGCAPSIGSVT